MKRTWIALALLFASSLALGQLVDSSRIKKKTQGGITGDSANSLAIGVHRGTSSPSGTPVSGQLWCDTNFSPCHMKIYTGSTWEAYIDSAVPIQDDFSSFPGSPSDGQIFVTRNPPELCYYDATNTKWWCFAAPGSQQGANVVDNFTGTTITAPSSALTLADNATAGNATAGTKSCKVTFANSTGGETTMSAASNTITFTASHSFDWTSIPTGGTGTTQRRIYCTKAGAAATGPWYWIYTVNDNSTTSVTAAAGRTDANLLRHGPKSNYSAALNARWTVVNHSSETTSGGCGSTGTSMACSQSSVATPINNAASDTTIRAILDLTPYNSGDFTIQYRVANVGLTADSTDGATQTPGLGTVRVGSADNAPIVMLVPAFNGQGMSVWNSPMQSTNPMCVYGSNRTTTGGSRSASGTTNCPWPRTTSFVWVRFVKKGNYGNFFMSANDRDWSPARTSNTTGEGGLAYDFSSGAVTQFELELNTASASGQMPYVEIDNFTLTVN